MSNHYISPFFLGVYGWLFSSPRIPREHQLNTMGTLGPGYNHRRYTWPNRYPQKKVYMLDLPPHPVAVTTRKMTFFVGNPYKPSCVTATGWGGRPNVYGVHFFSRPPFEGPPPSILPMIQELRNWVVCIKKTPFTIRLVWLSWYQRTKFTHLPGYHSMAMYMYI